MIKVTAIDGLMLREMMLAGAANLSENRAKVDALNVFPVPDGDTGTNMSLTMTAAIRELNAQDRDDACDAAEAIAKGALRGARGNSGVITSQLYRGFAKGLEGLKIITPMQFAQALKSGADMAYKAVMRPKEGTILTVARVIADEAVLQAEREPENFEALFQTIIRGGEEILSRTTEMLPVLKQAGVVDAGGYGLLLLYKGYVAALNGEKVESVNLDLKPVSPVTEMVDYIDDHDSMDIIEFAYCTEFLVQNLREDATDEDIDDFRRRLNRLGDCVLVVGDLSLVKVHVHTNHPGKALEAGLSLGELVGLKIENMVEQRRANLRLKAEKEPRKPYGMVAVSLGEGFSSIFTDLGVDHIVEGGQTMNPSIEDLQTAIDKIRADVVYVFPNNGNVILAAQQAAEICKNKVVVIPTKNVAMGIAGIVAFRPDMSVEENIPLMQEAAERVRTGTITYAVRDSEFENLHIHQDDIIGLHNGKVTVKADNIRDVARSLMKDIVTDEDSLITLYFGNDVVEEDAQALANEIEKIYTECDVEIQHGGQPLYYYLIAVE